MSTQQEHQDQSRNTRSTTPASFENSSSVEGGYALAPPPFQMKTANPIQKTEKPDWLDWGMDRIGDALNIRDNEAGRDAYEDYQDALARKREFKAGSHNLLNHLPSTGRGKFNAFYQPNQNKLLIAVKYDIKFLSGSKTDYSYASEDDLKWGDEEKVTWESKMKSMLYNQWSNKFTFYCQKDYWEDLSASTSVVFYKDTANPHYNFEVTKIPKHKPDGSLAFRGSAVTPPSNADDPTRAKLDSNDIESYDKLHTGANQQTPIVHEAGHMLGLGDEYPTTSGSNYTTEDPDKMKDGYAHEHLADEMCDVDVEVKKDERIMSSGDQFQPEHGVTFLEALRTATNMTEWDYDIKMPKAIPADPDLENIGDFPMVERDTQYA